ncbi:MAG: HRDC domain-containing protein [Promethearchaeota archaeon]
MKERNWEKMEGIREKARKLGIIHEKLTLLQEELAKLNLEKEALIGEIVNFLGPDLQDNNVFEFPRDNKVVHIERFKRKQLEPEVQKLISGIKAIAIKKGKFEVKEYFRLDGYTIDEDKKVPTYKEPVPVEGLAPMQDEKVKDEEKKVFNGHSVENSLNPKQNDCLKALKKWRWNKANRAGLPVYFIMQDRFLKEIVETEANTRKKLLFIKGMSANRIVKYGNDVLEIVRGYFPCNAHELECDISLDDLKEEIKEKSKLDKSKIAIPRRSELTSQENKLFEKLKAWRLALAFKMQVPPYFICYDKTLLHIIKIKPKTKDKLHTVWGLGSVKVEKYGDEILSILEKNDGNEHDRG